MRQVALAVVLLGVFVGLASGQTQREIALAKANFTKAQREHAEKWDAAMDSMDIAGVDEKAMAFGLYDENGRVVYRETFFLYARNGVLAFPEERSHWYVRSFDLSRKLGLSMEDAVRAVWFQKPDALLEATKTLDGLVPPVSDEMLKKIDKAVVGRDVMKERVLMISGSSEGNRLLNDQISGLRELNIKLQGKIDTLDKNSKDPLVINGRETLIRAKAANAAELVHLEKIQKMLAP